MREDFAAFRRRMLAAGYAEVVAGEM